MRDWVNRINEVIEWAENNLTEEINTKKISEIMACPYSVFQRSFVQIAGITLGEYIKQRKLTKAACDILNTNQKIVDVAMEYGYESADAFTVAFKKHHGITPSSVRTPEVNLKFYPRLRFTLSVKGVEEMDYRVVEKEAFKVIGRRRITSAEDYAAGSRGTWGVARADGSIDLMMKMIPPGTPFLGLCFGIGEDRSNDNMVGIEYDGDDILGLESYTFPKSRWLVFSDEGKINDKILYKLWDRIYSDFLPGSDYKQTNLPTIETYTEWNREKDYCKLEVWIPITK